MTAADLIAAYKAGKASADDPRARNPFTPAEPGTVKERQARMWVRGRLADVPDFPADT